MFGRFDLAALCGCRTLNFCLFVCLGWYICGGLTGHPAWLVLWIVFDLDTPISLLLVICLLVLLFAVSVVGCLLGYSSCLVVWIPLFLDPSDGAFGRFDLAALCGCRTLNFCLFVCFVCQSPVESALVCLIRLHIYIQYPWNKEPSRSTMESISSHITHMPAYHTKTTATTTYYRLGASCRLLHYHLQNRIRSRYFKRLNESLTLPDI